ncbi:hypothetical protein J6590_025309 [Homalodisca vitripennis]|nr:hypothetical protein J6590_025309 [Homalodisca vitripennis]
MGRGGGQWCSVVWCEQSDGGGCYSLPLLLLRDRCLVPDGRRKEADLSDGRSGRLSGFQLPFGLSSRRRHPVCFAVEQGVVIACNNDVVDTGTTIKLIEEFHSRPASWDVSVPEYKNRNKKRDEFIKVAKVLAFDIGEILVCQKKW